jgi:hypothetical protein
MALIKARHRRLRHCGLQGWGRTTRLRRCLRQGLLLRRRHGRSPNTNSTTSSIDGGGGRRVGAGIQCDGRIGLSVMESPLPPLRAGESLALVLLMQAELLLFV